ncbi:diguanylate cyclase [Pleurocapsales cyanobacterium LEGE 10410]|nr:diguanylate cyclase [Pleurocapsales cyanobacterium LEGE 10410]
MFEQERSPSKKERIMVVDDQLDNLDLLSTILNLQGYKVEVFDRGKPALETAQTKPPDVMLLDISMPEMDGFEVCRRIKNHPHTKDTPIIFVSSLNEVGNKTRAFRCGGSDYITKPFQLEEVIVRVENQLQISRLKAELEAKNTRLEQELARCQIVEEKLLQLNQKLGKLATIDSLTQIANRRTFEEALIREWQRGQREKQDLSLIICDIDHFKLYNDTYGHQAGDVCLRKVAQAILNTVMRPADLVARYGGEEFVVILPQTPANNALKVAEKIRLQIEQLSLPHPQSSVSDRVSISLGVTSVVPQPKYTRKQLLFTADKALYQAKKQGRNRAVLETLES